MSSLRIVHLPGRASPKAVESLLRVLVPLFRREAVPAGGFDAITTCTPLPIS